MNSYHHQNRNIVSGLIRIWIPLFVLLLILSACDMPADPTQKKQTEIDIATPESPPTDTPVPVPLRKLTICMAEEPQSLYLYDGRSDKAKWNVLDALYDGPIDQVGYQLQAVILEGIPDLAGGGLLLEAIAVQPGQEVVDANGRLTVLKKGVFVRPSGCQESACAVTWDGQDDFLMDRMVLEFKLIEGLLWSDGEALNADDSLFSFTLAADASTPVSKWAVDRSESYQALDAQTIKWTGKPGFLTADVDLFFWTPLPRHAWSGLSAEALLSSEMSNQQPIGWGPYMIETWVAGESMSLIKNPHYFRASEGLPVFDILEYKFISSASDGLRALGDGECDLLDSSFDLEAQIDTVLAAEADGDLSAYVQVGPQWEGITFGIKPASYDDGYLTIYGDRPDIFGDLRTRQAFAYCINRQQIVDDLLESVSAVPLSILPFGHPGLAPDLAQYPFDVSLGAQLLDAVGWKDLDNNPQTARQAWGVYNVPTATPFDVTLLSTPSIFHNRSAETIIESLAQCGIQVTWQQMPAEELFAPGPGGVLFGRQFDLTYFSWALDGRLGCGLYQSSAIPADSNYWVGANLGGYISSAYDQVCTDAVLSLAQSKQHADAVLDIQDLFAEELPAIPISYVIHIVVARNEIKNYASNPSGRSDFSALEYIVRTEN